MNRPRQVSWRHITAFIIGLAAVAALVAGGIIHSEATVMVRAARNQSQLAAAGFVQAAEEYFGTQAAEGLIRVDARQAFEHIVEGVLLGTARYVQVVLGDVVVANAADDEWAAAIPLYVPSSLAAADTTLIPFDDHQLLVDVVVPIGTRHPEAPAGSMSYARVGYEIPGLASQLRSIRLAGGGIALAAFVVACVCMLVALGWLDVLGILETPFSRIAHSLTSTTPSSGPLVLDDHSKQVLLHGQPVYLPPKPFQLLALLIRVKGRVLQEREIVDTLWPEAELADSRDVRQCVYLLRKRLDAAVAGAGACVANVKGFGYRFDMACLERLPQERKFAAIVDA